MHLRPKEHSLHRAHNGIHDDDKTGYAREALRVKLRSNTRRRGWATACYLALLPTLLIAPLQQAQADTDAIDGIDAETGFRMERYRAPVPTNIPGGITLDTKSVSLHHANGTLIFIDVYPPKGLGPDPLDGHWVISESHETIPGSTWLPEVGRGFLEEGHERYFRRNLARLSDNSLDAPLVFFCTADCWQSWNASKRAMDWGYTAVHWYPLGNDGWQEEGGILEAAFPLNFLDDSLPADAQINPDADADNGAGAIAQALAPLMRIALVDQEGIEHEIGTVSFSEAGADGASGIVVDLDGDDFSDHFLSMRPFRCLTDESEWFCYLPYTYEIKNTVSTNSLTDLEYHLLFILKLPAKFGIDAWDGLYYSLSLQDDGSIEGMLLQGDLNVLASPPAPGSYPIDLDEFIADGRDDRRFPAIVIRP